jgi:membrane protein implicated in regulation of membrane protease activity
MEFKSSLYELGKGFRNLLKSEVILIRTEFIESSRDLGHYFAFLVFFGVLALLGLIPFISFLVIGLGNLLHGNYWLSSLFVSIALILCSAIIGYVYLYKLRAKNLTLPQARNSLQHESEMLKNKVHEISEAMKRRTL